MNNKICKRFIISGLVQSVWYRASTQKIANSLEITGWAKNLPDGSVEVVACGTEQQVNELHKWLLQGPDRAQVDSVA